MSNGLDRHLPDRINLFVPNMQYAADVGEEGYCRMDLGILNAASATAFLSAQSIATASNANIDRAAQTEAVMGQYGRTVQVVASGAATSTVTVTGYDYLGQKVVETLTLNGTTPVLGQKAFKYVSNIAWGVTAATTINVGTANGLGLPYRTLAIERELLDGAISGNSGALAAGLATSGTPSATNADTRGRYTPHASDVPNASRRHVLIGLVDKTALHGIAHYAG